MIYLFIIILILFVSFYFKVVCSNGYCTVSKSKKSGEQILRIKEKLYTLLYKAKQKNNCPTQIKNFNNNILLLESPVDSNAYSINKKITFLCTKNVSDNLLTYVAIHELSHQISPTYGHDSNFHEIFNYLTNEAERDNLLFPISNETNYCNVKL